VGALRRRVGRARDGIEKVATARSLGIGLKDFFDHALRGTKELDYSVFAHVGLEVRLAQRENSATRVERRRARATTRGPVAGSAFFRKAGSGVASVLEGSPAMAAGIYADDEIVALDGTRCDASSLITRCEERRPGEQVRVTLFRRERLTTVEVTVGTKPLDTVWLARVEQPTEAQKASWAAWLGVAWEEPE
jgi:predicted metalloprotease with PDZ domain